MKLYKSGKHLNQWIAYVPGTGWLAFPAKADGWKARRAARGLDPVYLREVPVRLASECGMPAEDAELLQVA